ncbi:hypothetical protein A2691_02230 [Candidatus Woesebacteria bacterium RIFCSPHIGHO2_01_FULL_39_23]|uniref:ABC transporter substrate-binding protein n=1 Tax=candidate division WWE3 bacterium RIFCSPLOWO2_01_FULL_37_15 TaxID=1802622 RepID=A0A1F4UXH1_UNCKA|nr:MAG: hypothetical protein A3A69_00170 [candidate division WWE3 bacterium RIFCSPLOWO2_01_FULL_37_15]OGM22668.1 MAG: hypothetical protein A2691_02230 [Candidatus Woesebacteria bacterium RIFCSPHIGHO2_01_FULL_39_23]
MLRLPKKILLLPIVIIIVLLVLLVIRSLGGGTPGGQEGKEIVWWGNTMDESLARFLIEEYTQDHSDIKITYEKKPADDYRERLTNAIAKGEGPDIFRLHNTWIPMFKKDLDPMPGNVMTAEEFSKTFYQVASADLSSGNGMLGMPLEFDNLGLFINEDIFALSGLSVPEIWDDFRSIVPSFIVRDNRNRIQQSAIALGETENVDHWPEFVATLMLQNGVRLSNPVGGNAEDVLTYYNTFQTRERVWDTALPRSTEYFAQGKLAMYFGPAWRALQIRNINPDLKFKVVPVPQLPTDELVERPTATYSVYWVEGVWNRSQSKRAAWEFLKFISSKEIMDALYQKALNEGHVISPPSRVDMGGEFEDHPYFGTAIKQSSFAQTWYLADNTNDGPTGINTQLNTFFKEALKRGSIGNLPSEITKVLSQYGLNPQK